jgi:hypothetical protein
MRTKIILLSGVVILIAFMLSCAPVSVQKCYSEFTYGQDGKVVKEYKECLTQVPERLPPVHLKNKDLYE